MENLKNLLALTSTCEVSVKNQSCVSSNIFILIYRKILNETDKKLLDYAALRLSKYYVRLFGGFLEIFFLANEVTEIDKFATKKFIKNNQTLKQQSFRLKLN